MRLLHVTDCLPRPAHPCDPWYLERGRAVHLACHYADTVGLNMESLDPRIQGYVEAWERCKRETGYFVVESERKVEGAGYVGTLDKIMATQRLGDTFRYFEVWDLKCGGPEPWHGLQLAAYEVCVRVGKKPMRRRCVHLSEDGTFRLVEHKDPADFRRFMAYLTVAYFEINNGLREQPAEREE